MEHIDGICASALPKVDARVIGNGSDSIYDLELRLRPAFPATLAVAWEVHAAPFQFTYVSPDAELLLGYPRRRWLLEPDFWAEMIFAPEDRTIAEGYCALAAAVTDDRGCEYHARTAEGRPLIMRNIAAYFPGNERIPDRLRRLMFDVTAARSTQPSGDR